MTTNYAELIPLWRKGYLSRHAGTLIAIATSLIFAAASMLLVSATQKNELTLSKLREQSASLQIELKRAAKTMEDERALSAKQIALLKDEADSLSAKNRELKQENDRLLPTAQLSKSILSAHRAFVRRDYSRAASEYQASLRAHGMDIPQLYDQAGWSSYLAGVNAPPGEDSTPYFRTAVSTLQTGISKFPDYHSLSLNLALILFEQRLDRSRALDIASNLSVVEPDLAIQFASAKQTRTIRSEGPNAELQGWRQCVELNSETEDATYRSQCTLRLVRDGPTPQISFSRAIGFDTGQPPLPESSPL